MICPQNFPKQKTLPQGSKSRNYALPKVGAFGRIYAPVKIDSQGASYDPNKAIGKMSWFMDWMLIANSDSKLLFYQNR
jgi:hypothetical protein